MAILEDFMKIDIRVGKIIDVQDFPEARKPSFKLRIDFGKEIGIKRSCAQLTANYNKDELTDKLVLCVVNLPSRQIGAAISEVLTLGVPDDKNECILIIPDKDVPLGGKLYQVLRVKKIIGIRKGEFYYPFFMVFGGRLQKSISNYNY